MHTIEQIFINGEFITPHGTEWFDLYNPATAQVIGQVRLADEVDGERAGGESCVSGVVADHKAGTPRGAKTHARRRGRPSRRSAGSGH